MNNAREAYTFHAQRVAQLIGWLEDALKNRKRNASLMVPAHIGSMVNDLRFIEHTLKLLVSFASGTSAQNIDSELGEGGCDE